MDIIQQLGALAFASRLKRISERLMKDASRIYGDLDVEFQARWFPVMYLLGHNSSLSVTEIARELGLTHPAINQISSSMTKAGLLKSTKDKLDERKRLLSISKKGREVFNRLMPVWNDIETATREVIHESGENLLAILNNVEYALDKKDIYERVTARIKKRQYDNIEIVDYEPKWRKEFERLNVEWLEKYFTVEAYDRAILTDPRRRIINKGGFVIFARQDNEIVGTVAVIHHDDGTLELAKMAVTEKSRGRQIGKRLAHAAIDKVKAMGAKKLILYTSVELAAANNLYHKIGFKEIVADQPTKYERLSITMSLDLETMDKKQ